MQVEETYEDVLQRAFDLRRKGDTAGARQVLEHGAKSERALDRHLEAGALVSTLGSYLAIEEHHDEALEKYLEAEELFNGDVGARLTTARHLLVNMRSPRRAVEHLESVDPSTDSISSALYVDVLSIRGLASVEIGEITEAQSCVTRIVDHLPRSEELGVDVLTTVVTLLESLAKHPGRLQILEKCLELCRRRLMQATTDPAVVRQLALVEAILSSRRHELS